uniref:Receptor-like protein EIX2 n=1 Tax=Elaeis guineensis var. tenera TaxID=51953 RepID=A0A6J0PGP7_ELAGV|nr:receptor-like protein EIX2 [Elaeis guineensis]
MAVSSSLCTNRSCFHMRIMLIGLLLFCISAIPLCLCLGDRGGSILGGSCIESERRALFAIKADIYDPDQWLSSWGGQDCCGWRGVGCDNSTGHVVKLDLRYPYTPDFQEEIGKFPGRSKVNPSLLDLMHLKYLDLSLNNFSGAPIPKFIGSLVHLEYLNLSNAEFSGSVPSELGNLSSLYFLDLHSDSYYCQCYNFFCPNCVDVNRWFLYADDLHWLSRIHSLQFLDMSRVNLSKAANWLHEINMLPSLLELHLFETYLPSIPSTLSHVNLTSLRVLDLSWNDNIKAIVSNLLFNISSSLAHLNLEAYDFPDSLLVAIGDMCNLQHLDLSYNQITGEIFQSIGNLSHLQHLDLSSNHINREIFQNLRNLSQLQHLDLSFNQINGDIFQNLENLSHLKYLDLSENNISGDIPEKLGNLKDLENLLMDNNRISGVIPKSFGNLCSLLELSLRGNLISGEIPESIGNLVQLQQMDLSSNMIGGQIPDVFDKLHSLRTLALPRNRMTGKIPRSMGNLCTLSILDISQNNINGEIADTIEGLSKCTKNMLDPNSSLYGLIYLDMSSNNLSGTVPESLAWFSALQILSFASNSFTGRLTETHFTNLTRLEELELSYNSFEVILNHNWDPPFNAQWIGMCSCHLGPKFPTWLRTQTNLYGLQLSENNISNDFPSWFWDLHITGLNISLNSMTGKLPTSLRGRQYANIDMSSNNFHGLLPELDPSFLSIINLSNNSFEGPIPLSFARAMGLKYLLLSNNYINGSIPPFICNLTQLVILDLSNNNLSGRLPNCWHIDSQKDNILRHSQGSMAGPINLQSLHMRNNSLSGDFPLFFKYCEQLAVLDLGENKFSGNLPLWIGESLVSLRVLSLRSNFFNGNIPEQLSYLTSLQVLDLAYNSFSDVLPPSIGNLSAMMATGNVDKPGISKNYGIYYTESLLMTTNGIEIEYTSVLSLVMSIDLSHNNLSGVIPEELVNLRGLLFLNLSNNHFTGRIPENIGALEQLESLDLSVNNLSGMIPTTMSSMYFLTHLNLSTTICQEQFLGATSCRHSVIPLSIMTILIFMDGRYHGALIKPLQRVHFQQKVKKRNLKIETSPKRYGFMLAVH